ncbi:type II toxin-antitoxin system HicA family toxin, partial [Acetobacter sicerae]|uniref:hypothetical protein n=1 Tax=Acetobacter sicerae TaxID=85325 RepID=UPI001A7E57CE
GAEGAGGENHRSALTMTRAPSRTIRDLMRRFAPMGWTARVGRGGHVRWQHETGALYFSAATPGDWRVVRNIEAGLKRAARGG